MSSVLETAILPTELSWCMVGGVGIEPTEPEGNGVTDRPSSPTLAPSHIILGVTPGPLPPYDSMALHH